MTHQRDGASMILNVADIFCGTKSIGNEFKCNGHNVVTLDWDDIHSPDLCVDYIDIEIDDILSYSGWDKIDYIHFSPDCTTYSIAAISKHRNKDGSPKSIKAAKADEIREKMVDMVYNIQPTLFTIENPVGKLRKFTEMVKIGDDFDHSKITYCQYGSKNMKPTDIWHNIPTLELREPCKNGMTCHESAPRGSRCGIQGSKNAIERGKIPYELCKDIRIAVEEYYNANIL